MITIEIFPEWEKIEGQHCREVVLKMKNSSPFTAEENLKEYMQNLARRVKVWNGATVRTEDCIVFLIDLEKAGMIKMQGAPYHRRERF